MSRTTVIQNEVERLRAGDGSARDELLLCARERLSVLAHKMRQDFPGVARWEETDDIFQNALLRLYHALEQVELQDARHFLRLAALQIRRELIDMARRYQGPHGLGRRYDTAANRNPRPDGESQAPRHEPSDETFNPVRIHDWSELHAAVERLPDEQREVFDLVWYHELPQDEVAQLLGVTTRTVKRRWRAARLALHGALQGELPGEG